MSKKSSSNTAGVIVTIIVSLVIIGFILIQSGGTAPSNTNITDGVTSNVTMRNGIQYIAIDAKGGYKPRTSYAKGGVPTKLIMNTENTYDCSSALVVRSANYRGMLPQTGETEIDLGTPKVGDKIPGTCSMGMYNFSLIFN